MRLRMQINSAPISTVFCPFHGGMSNALPVSGSAATCFVVLSGSDARPRIAPVE
jgi:hypothetical protein